MEHWHIFLRILLAAFLGALIGVEREYFGKAAGFRTHALVSAAASLIMLVSIEIFERYGAKVSVDPSRIAAQVVSGIGFIGAGAIIRSGGSVKGITTAASLWSVSAIGLACGMGFYDGALYATAVVIIILLIFTKLEAKLIKKPANGTPQDHEGGPAKE
ncbi:MAG: MgtC/SapB family protein [Candidatus Omnitrophica bacterium]|nr:MgtC/SapB family protein [Candidatus Omnitrophota bacterium]